MNQQLINPAIFAYTLWVKFEDRRNILPLILFCVTPITMLMITMLIPHPPFTVAMQKSIGGMMSGYFSSTLINVMVCYVFISDGPAGRKLVAEADSLALTFTRPLTRFSYVLSKYCAGLIGCTVTLSIGLLLSYAVGLCVGFNQIDISPMSFATILCNAASWAALVVFLHSAPPVVSILTYLFLNGAGGMGGIFTRTGDLPNEYLEYFKTVCLFIYRWFGDILPQSVNLADMFSAASFDTYEAAIYFSNISLLLLFATAAMAKREFTYGSD